MEGTTPDGPVVFSRPLTQNSVSDLKVHKSWVILCEGKPMKRLKLYFSM
jgi:hypothetical protein